MAKKKGKEEEEEVVASISRKQQLREQRDANEKRQVQLIMAGVVGLLVLILLVGIIIEFFVVPNQSVANVNGADISLGDWQEQVEYQRAQLIVSIDEQYDIFFDDEAEDPDEAEATALQTVQQFSGQQIALLTSAYDVLGEFVIDRMVEDELIRQGAAERGLSVSEAEIEETIGERFNYFDGGLPTPLPSATPSPEPTPSLTPIGFVDTTTDTEEDAGESLPASTPVPTATAVSAEAFQEELDGQIDSLAAEGVNTDLYRQEVEIGLLREKLADELFIEQEVDTEAEHVSAFILSFTSEEAANEAMASIDAGDFLTVWNLIRSTPPDPESTEPPAAQATEILWRTQDQFGDIFTMNQFAGVLFATDIGDNTGVVIDAQGTTPAWLIAQVSGREVRELPEFSINQLKQEALSAWLEEQQSEALVETYENWRARVPRQPALDLRYVQPVQPHGGATQ